MPEISMTTFIDFVVASGTTKLTVVRRAKEQYQRGYSQSADFYRPVREAIIEMHREGQPTSHLDGVPNSLGDPRKISAFSECGASYKKWWGRKTIEWIGSFNSIWTYQNLAVRVNPELCLRINNQDYVIKMYFKAEKPSKPRLETMFHLLRINIPVDAGTATPSILDVRRANLFSPNRNIPDVNTLLNGEALSFQTMWDQI